MPVTKFTLCWDCAKACGECSWSRKLIPVEGWVAWPRQVRIDRGGILKSFVVVECPEFERDAYNGGTKWAEEKSPHEWLSNARITKNCQKQG